MNQSWMRKRWFDFRQGHSVYLIFLLTFSNFVLIFHRLLVERIDFLNEIFSELWIFILVFIFAYVPIAIIVGAWHRKTQLKVDTEAALHQNPLWAKMFRVMIDVQTGKASKEEIESVRKFLTSIENKGEN
ncbi:MAG: hypothetical protein IS860_00830 [Nitrosopumilus sp.]|nr:hypothetical protein [Nitrosopumilus sp.]